MQKNILPNSNFEFFTKGDRPILLLHAGTHGDEHEVIDIVTKTILKYESQLPSFIYVPHVSPSAVSQKTRHNSAGFDSNRIFLDDTDEAEIKWNQEVMRMSIFDLAVSFHEDPEYKTYYIYDDGVDHSKSDLILAHNDYLTKNGIDLLNGPDDIHDASVTPEIFTNGYKKFDFVAGDDTGEILSWGMNKGIIKHALIPETPGNIDMAAKELIIDGFFSMVLVKYFES